MADGATRAAPVSQRDRGPASAIYDGVTESGGRTYVDYWWFLRFNDFGNRTVRKF